MAQKPRDYKPIEFRQLCMVVKTVLQRNPSIDDAEWKAKTREVLSKMGFDEPPTDLLSQAMTQVEMALKKTVGPRLVRAVPMPPEPPAPEPLPQKELRNHQPAGWDLVLRLMAKLESNASASSLPTRPTEPAEVLGITEEAALDEFWRQVREGADRTALLKAFAEVAIVRPAGWDYLDVRAKAGEHALSHAGCICCGGHSRIDWHHVIQIQFGGSNYLRNRVPLCDACHTEVHPWLQGAPRKRSVGGFTSLGDIKAPEMKQDRQAS